MLDEAADMVSCDGFPNRAINYVHRTAVESLCDDYEVVADGTRFNDRVPVLTRAEVQSIEGRTGRSYVRPLLGFTKREVDRLVDRFLVVQHGETGTIQNGDYEAEIREACSSRGLEIPRLFPKNHDQSLVIGRKTSLKR